MPVLLTESASAPRGKAPVELSLFDESGEPTLAGQVVADFLESADFSSLFSHPEAKPYIITVVDEADENVSEEVLPGSIALRLIDEKDLSEMFLHYLDLLGENASGEDANLDEKAKLAVFVNHFLKPMNEAWKKGAFKKLAASGQGAKVHRMFNGMISKGDIKHTKSGRGYKGGDWTRAGRYGQAEKQGHKSTRMRIRKSKAGQIKRTMNAERKGRSRAKSLAASVGMEEGLLFGFGTPYSGATFLVSANPDAVVEFAEGEFDAIQKRYAPMFENVKLVKGVKGMRFNEAEAKDEESNDDKNESAGQINAPFALGVGAPTLSESADIACRVGNVMGFGKKKPTSMNEAKT